MKGCNCVSAFRMWLPLSEWDGWYSTTFAVPEEHTMMRNKPRTSLFFLVAFALTASSLALSQDARTTTSQSTTKQAEPSQAPTAKDLSFLIGKWETTIVLSPSALMPTGTTGKGTAEFQLFGQAIEDHRASDTGRGHNEQRELIVYQNTSNSYLIFTVNSNGIATQRTLTRYIDDWVVEYRGHNGDKDFTVRGRYKIISANELQYTAEMNVDDSGFKPYSEITFKRPSTN